MLRIDNSVINTPIEKILKQIRIQCSNQYFKDIINKGNELLITCPCHKGGNETHPSCYIVSDLQDEKTGVWHCFTCGSSGTLVSLVQFCFNWDIVKSSEWLVENFSDTLISEESLILPEITFESNKKKEDESILESYRYYHPYMFSRGLTEDIIKKFDIGCTPDGNFITFPCWDIHNKFIGVLMRSVKGKQFIIPKNIEKPIYLLNFVLSEGNSRVFICEGLFDALKMWVYGFPAAALCGAGTTETQMSILNSTGIREYILMYDNDLAGRNGANRFKKLIRKDVIVTDIIMPKEKDCGNCSEEEIKKILSVNHLIF